MVYRQVKEPENREDDRVAEAGNRHAAEGKPGPGNEQQCRVRMIQPENGGEPPKSGRIGTQSVVNSPEEQIDGQKAMGTDQRDQLLCGNQESDCIHGSENPKKN